MPVKMFCFMSDRISFFFCRTHSAYVVGMGGGAGFGGGGGCCCCCSDFVCLLRDESWRREDSLSFLDSLDFLDSLVLLVLLPLASAGSSAGRFKVACGARLPELLAQAILSSSAVSRLPFFGFAAAVLFPAEAFPIDVLGSSIGEVATSDDGGCFRGDAGMCNFASFFGAVFFGLTPIIARVLSLFRGRSSTMELAAWSVSIAPRANTPHTMM